MQVSCLTESMPAMNCKMHYDTKTYIVWALNPVPLTLHCINPKPFIQTGAPHKTLETWRA